MLYCTAQASGVAASLRSSHASPPKEAVAISDYIRCARWVLAAYQRMIPERAGMGPRRFTSMLECSRNDGNIWQGLRLVTLMRA